MIVPGEIHIAGTSFVTPHVAALAVEHRFAPLAVASDVVVGRTGIRVVVELRDRLLPLITRMIAVPCVQVGLDMIFVAGRIVLDQPRRIELLRLVVHAAYPLLRFRQESPFGFAFFVGFSCIGEQPPRFVEINPRENRRVVVVSLDLCTHAVFPILLCGIGRFAPEIRRVGHDQQAQFVGPVKFAGHFDLNVDTVAV